jgi:hypothetical protein
MPSRHSVIYLGDKSKYALIVLGTCTTASISLYKLLFFFSYIVSLPFLFSLAFPLYYLSLSFFLSLAVSLELCMSSPSAPTTAKNVYSRSLPTHISVVDEREAKRISNAIDRRLAAERAALAKDRTAKLLILGKCPL